MNQTTLPYSSINIIGSGCIGHLLALKLSEQQSQFKQSVRLFSRTAKERRNVVYKNAVTRYSKEFDYLTIDKWQMAELIVICVKAPQLKAICNQLSFLKNAFVEQNAPPLLLMMNGMGHMEKLSGYFPELPILQGITTHGAKFEHNTLIHSGQGTTKIGGYEHQSLSFHKNKVHELLSPILPSIEICDDIDTELWKKLFINAIINPLTTLHRVNNGQIIDMPDINQSVIGLCSEIIPFQNKLGIPQSQFSLYESVVSIAKTTTDNISSMRQDHIKGQKSEIDSITGYLLKKAASFNIELPLHEEIYRKIKTLENHF